MADENWLEPLIRGMKTSYSNFEKDYASIVALRDMLMIFENDPAGRKTLDELNEKIRAIEIDYEKYAKAEAGTETDSFLLDAIHFLDEQKAYKEASKHLERFKEEKERRAQAAKKESDRKMRRKLAIGAGIGAAAAAAIFIGVTISNNSHKKEMAEAYEAYTQAMEQEDYKTALELGLKHGADFIKFNDPDFGLDDPMSYYLMSVIEQPDEDDSELADRYAAALEIWKDAEKEKDYSVPMDLDAFAEKWVVDKKDPAWIWDYLMLKRDRQQEKGNDLDEEAMAYRTLFFEYGLQYITSQLKEQKTQEAVDQMRYAQGEVNLFLECPIEMDEALSFTYDLVEAEVDPEELFEDGIRVYSGAFDASMAISVTRQDIQKAAEAEGENEDESGWGTLTRFPEKVITVAVREAQPEITGSLTVERKESDIQAFEEDSANYEMYLLPGDLMALAEEKRPLHASEIDGWLVRGEIFVNSGFVMHTSYKEQNGVKKDEATLYYPYYHEADLISLYMSDETGYRGIDFSRISHEPPIYSIPDSSITTMDLLNRSKMVGSSDQETLKADYRDTIDLLWFYELAIGNGEE